MKRFEVEVINVRNGKTYVLTGDFRSVEPAVRTALVEAKSFAVICDDSTFCVGVKRLR